MVQIMNSGQSSRNRAERASLDFPAGVPASDSLSNSVIDSPSTEKIKQSNPEIGEALVPEEQRDVPSAILEGSDDEEDDLERGNFTLMPESLAESNNNLSEESSKDWGIVTDPWAASSALTLPDEIDGAVLKKSLRGPKHKNHRHVHRRLSKGSSGSGSGSGHSSGRRGSSSSSKEVASIETESKAPSSTDTKSDEQGFKPILYCYRCYTKFTNYAAWRKHAVYEHILTKNPYPIVEMNYIDPNSLQLGLCTEMEMETEADNPIPSSMVEDELIEPIDPGSGADSPKEQLKLKFCKEKGTYFVKQSSVSEDTRVPVNDDIDSVLETEPTKDKDDVVQSIEPEVTPLRSMLEERLLTNPTSAVVEPAIETEAVVDAVEVNTPKKPESHPAMRSILQRRLQKKAPVASVVQEQPPKSLDKAVEIKKTPGQFQRAMSIESELLVLNDDEFEKALEQATERSRIFATADQNAFVFGSSNVQPAKDSMDKGTGAVNIPTATGGETKAATETDHIPDADTAIMISQDLPLASTISQIVHEDKSSSEEVPILIDKECQDKQDDVSPAEVFLEKVKEASVIHRPELEDISDADEPKEPPDISESKGDKTGRSNMERNEESTDSDSYALKIVDNDGVADGTKQSSEEQAAIGVNKVGSLASSETTVDVAVSLSDKVADGEEEKSTPVDSDDFQCRVCHKIFLSDEEVKEHFSEEHFRLAVGQRILEPESPFPENAENRGYRSIFTEEEAEDNDALQDDYPNNRRLSADHQQPPTGFAEALAGLLAKNHQAGNSTVNSGISRGLPNPNRPSNPMPRGPPMYVQHSGTRPLNHNVRMGQPSIHNPMGQLSGLPNMRPPLSSAPSFMNNQNGPRYMMTTPGRPPLHMTGQGPRPQGGNAPPQLSHRPPHYPTSLHTALTASNAQAVQTGHGQIRSGGPPNQVTGPGGFVPQRPPLRPIQQSQHQSHSNINTGPQIVDVTSLRGAPSSPNSSYGQLSQTIAQQQHLLNELNSQRERSAFQQQQLQLLQLQRQRQQLQQMQQHQQQQMQQQQQQQQQKQQNAAPQMPRLQQYPQQTQQQQQLQHHQTELQLRSSNEPSRIVQVTRTQAAGGGPSIMQGKRPATIEMVDVSSRGNKQPRMDHQFHANNQMRNLPPAEITISQRIVSSNNNGNISNNNVSNNSTHKNAPPLTLDRTVVAALGSVGSSGVNSVRIGNAITLSVCPTTSQPSSFSTNPERMQSSSTNAPSNPPVNLSSRSLSGASSPVINMNPNQMSSVLAVRGVTVTPANASPPIASISPASTSSNPSPSGSPSLHHQQQHNSVIQRCSASSSPVNHFSPPANAITTIRHSIATSLGNNNHSPHNFAIPRLPPPTRGHNVPPPNAHSPTYSLNTTADRPDRPPTVDLTDDDIQAYNNQLRMAGISHTNNLRQPHPQQQSGEQQRRVVTSEAHIIGSNPYAARGPRPVCCTICGVLFSSIQALEEHKLSSHGQRSNFIAGPRGPQTAVRSSGIQIREVRSMHPQHMGMVHTPPVRAPASPVVSRAQAPFQQYQVRQTAGSPSRPTAQPPSPNNPGKYLYIPLLDLTRMDSNKMRRLEEIGISCIVPLHGNNSLSQMGIPVMNLRSDGMMGQHIPWDSVLPMGPVHQPSQQQSLPPPPNTNRGVNTNTNTNTNGPLSRSQQ